MISLQLENVIIIEHTLILLFYIKPVSNSGLNK